MATVPTAARDSANVIERLAIEPSHEGHRPSCLPTPLALLHRMGDRALASEGPYAAA